MGQEYYPLEKKIKKEERKRRKTNLKEKLFLLSHEKYEDLWKKKVYPQHLRYEKEVDLYEYLILITTAKYPTPPTV